MEVRKINGEMLTLEETVKKNERLIWSIANRYFTRGTIFGLEAGDIFSLCSIGMIKAFNKFDPETYDVKFSTYAVPMMIGEMQRYFRDNSGDVKFSRNIVELGNKIVNAGLEDESVETIMNHFDEGEDIVKRAIIYLHHRKARRVDEVVYQNDGEDITLGDQLGKRDDFSKVDVNVFLDSLDDRDRQLIEMTTYGMTQQEIGDKIGVSQVQVSRLLKKLYPVIEEYFGYPIGYFQDRPKINVSEEKKVMFKNSKNKSNKRRIKGDIEQLKILLAETDRTPCSIAKETGCTDSSAYYWAKKIREPEAEENPVVVSKIPDPIKLDEDGLFISADNLKIEKEDAQKFVEAIQEELFKSTGISPDLLDGPKVDVNEKGMLIKGGQLSLVEFGVPDSKLDQESKYQEEMMHAEEAAKLAEEHRINLLKNASIGFGYHISSNDLTPSDLHVLFTQAGHAAASTGLETINVNIVLTTDKINA